jgi:DNA mismatch repair protein MutS
MNVGEHLDLVMVLTKALKIDLPLHSRDGGFIVDGFSQAFDELRELRDESRQLIAGLQARYIEISGVQGLKIKHNNVLGYFIEVSLRNEEFMPVVPSGVFIRRQTMKNVVRYTTIELSDLEGKIASAADKLIAMELELYDELIGSVLGQAEQIASIASALACIDVSAALATLAIEQGYSRPEIDESLNFDVYGGRHPIVERAVLDENNLSVSSGDPTNFVANDCNLTGASKIWLLTGPNMAGKSTVLRQNALMVVLAQMGSFIPADKAHIGVVDRLFSRVGAGDDLARGRSTFMVEMIETATILSQATERSFVILDEIGRGTATFDGLSIAWAVVEHLYENNRSRTLFATHYHELTRLSSRLDGLTCHMMRVKEWHENIIFLHEVIPGAADQSYGIHVGQLAGLPESVVRRANQVLASLKGSNPPGDTSLPTINQLKFDAKLECDHQTNVVKSSVEIELDKILPDELSPKAALELIYKLKSIIK